MVSVDVKQHGTTSTESIGTIRDGEPRTSTWTFTQLLSSGSMLLYIQGLLLSPKDHIMDYYGRGGQDVHLDFHTASEL